MAPTTPTEALTSAQHYAKAVRLLAQAEETPRFERKGLLLDEASVHATLSLYVADAIEIPETPKSWNGESLLEQPASTEPTPEPITAEEAAETLAKSSHRRRAPKPVEDEAAADAVADAAEEAGA
jgi:hypothetical protein